MAANKNVLERYALAFIKKSGGKSGIDRFLQSCIDKKYNLVWSEEKFDEIYKQYKGYPQNNTNSSPQYSSNLGRSRNNDGGGRNSYTQSDIWDILLLQSCINSLFGRGTVNNVTNVYSGNNNIDNQKKDKEDDRKLLAAGIVVAVVIAAFHIGMCYWYHNSRKNARKSGDVDYLDNKLKTFRNIEFLSFATSLAALVACVVYPVLPAWGLVALGVHSVACLVGGIAFHMKHEGESVNIEEAKGAVKSYITNPNSPSPTAPQYNQI